jgi:serine/threonine-protein kinase PpkA
LTNFPKISGYDIKELLREGGEASVYLARDTVNSRDVALKVFSGPADDAFLRRFVRQAYIIGGLRHEHIVRVFEASTSGDYFFIAMEYCPRGSLADELAENGVLGADRALHILRCIAQALACAHAQDVVHRDLKPGNILLRDDGTPILTDFGIAKLLGHFSYTRATLGTPHYMSPEQVRNQKLGRSSDFYSLGCVFWEMLTGTVPYEADTNLSIPSKHLFAPVPRLPKHYASYQPLLNRLMAKDPDDRFQSAEALLEALKIIGTSDAIQWTRRQLTDESGFSNALRKWLIISLLVVILLCGFGLVLLAVLAMVPS